MTDLIPCTCGFRVRPGLDCALCGVPASELAEVAEALAELGGLREL